ncbi:MAG: hypothetical protein J1F31_02410 [Erysipelotrichales bacterium]|nr:hypothetical protein [Erysipelotrichales bacterium]
MRYQILQSNTYDCGFVVLKVMLANVNRDKNYLLMPELKGRKYSLLDLKEIAKEHQLGLEGYKIDDIDTLDSFTFPMICQIKKAKCEHFILLNKIKNNKYYIFDPSVGEIILSFEEFSEVFNHNIMIISEHQRKKYAIKKGKTDINLLFSLIFNSVAATLFFISLMFINDYALFFLIVGLGMISLLLQKIASQKFIKETNVTYNLNYENLLDVSSYQKYMISNITNTPSRIVMFFALIIMMNNSYAFGYLNVFFILVIIGLYYLLNSELKYESRKIEYLEQCRHDLNDINKSAIKYGNKVTLIIAMFSVFIAIFVFYMMKLNDLVGIDFFLMQFSLMFGALVLSKNLLSFDEARNEIIRRKIAIDKYQN